MMNACLIWLCLAFVVTHQAYEVNQELTNNAAEGLRLTREIEGLVSEPPLPHSHKVGRTTNKL